MKQLIVFALVWFTCAAFADPVVLATNRNATLTYQVSMSPPEADYPIPIVPGMKVSGTGVEFSTDGGVALRLENPLLPDHWDHGFITSIQLVIGSEQIAIDPPVTGEPLRRAISVRFASTHFPHGSTQTIKVKFTYRLQRIENDEVVEEAEIDDLPYAEFPVVIHNSAFSYASLRTSRLAGGFIDTSKTNDLVKDNIAIVSASRSSFSPTHNFELGAAEQTAVDNLSMAAKMKNGTLFVAATHGTNTYIEGSLGDPTRADYAQLLAFAYPSTRSPVPPYNLALVWACFTLATPGDVAFPEAFKVAKPNQFLRNRAYAGYDREISYKAIDRRAASATDPFGGLVNSEEQAKLLFSLLTKGRTIGEAVLETNDQIQLLATEPDENGDIVPVVVDMIVKGDFGARIINVYLTIAERFQLMQQNRSLDIWFYTWSPQ